MGAIYGIQFNGNTNVLTASQAGLTAGATYHIKLIVTDVKDGGYDSGVFLEAASFGSPVVLPVELLGFSAECKDDLVELGWQTASEINNDYFLIEKSNDAVNFSPVGEIIGSGNSNTIHNYSFQDFELENELVYYRLKQVDFNGKTSYSNLIALNKCEDVIYEISNTYYNGYNELVINYNTNKFRDVEIVLYDVQGKLVLQKQLSFYQNQQQVRIPIQKSLDDAVYMLRIVSEETVNTEKIIISK